MKIGKLIQIDTATKVQYCLFHFFTPIALTGMLLSDSGIPGIVCSIISLISIVIGILLLVNGLKNHNKFLNIDEEKIYVCQGNLNNLKVLNMIDPAALDENNRNLLINKLHYFSNGKKITLLNYNISKFVVISFLGPLMALFILKDTLFNNWISSNLESIFSNNSVQNDKKPIIALDIFLWILAIFVIIFGVWSLILIPLYPFIPVD